MSTDLNRFAKYKTMPIIKGGWYLFIVCNQFLSLISPKESQPKKANHKAATPADYPAK